MKRKLIQLSPSTMVVSMPSQWIKANKLSKGTDVSLQQVENAILISTDAKRLKEKITVDLRGLDGVMVFTYADAAYIAGYDEITFLIEKDQRKSVMQYVATEVPGMIISSQTNKEVVFKDITANHQEDVDMLISRIFNMIISILEDGIVASKDKEWLALKKMKQQDYILNSYIGYAQRLINKFGYAKFSKTGLIITYLKLLEMFSDKCVGIMKQMSREKVSLTKELQIVLEVFMQVRKTHVKYSQAEVKTFDLMRKKINSKNKSFHSLFQEIQDLCYEIIEIEVQFQM